METVNEVRSPDLLGYATMGGAKALGLDDRIGSLTVGKHADLVLMRPDPMAMPARLDPVAHVVSQGRAELIDLVMVGGKIMRHGGRITAGVPYDKVLALVNASQERLIAAVGEDAMAHAASTPAKPDRPPMRTLGRG